MDDPFVTVAISAFVAVFVSVLAYESGRQSVANDCKHLSAFEHKQEVFDCKKRGG